MLGKVDAARTFQLRAGEELNGALDGLKMALSTDSTEEANWARYSDVLTILCNLHAHVGRNQLAEDCMEEGIAFAIDRQASKRVLANMYIRQAALFEIALLKPIPIKC